MTHRRDFMEEISINLSPLAVEPCSNDESADEIEPLGICNNESNTPQKKAETLRVSCRSNDSRDRDINDVSLVLPNQIDISIEKPFQSDGNEVSYNDCNIETKITSESDGKDEKKEIALDNVNKSQNEHVKINEEKSGCISNAKKILYLEEALNQEEQNSMALKTQLDETITKFTEQNISMKSDLLTRLEAITKHYETSERDKQSMVIKYANSEKEVIILKKQMDKLEKCLKDANKDKEMLQRNTRSLLQENVKKTNAYDKKVQEYGQLSRQVDKLKDEINARNIKTKWREHKLQVEVDAHTETQQKLDRELNHRKRHEDEMASVMRDASQVVASIKSDEISRANVLEKLLKEAKAKLIMETQKSSDLNSSFIVISNEFNVLKDIHSTQEDDLGVLRKKVFKYESEREESEKLVTSLQAQITSSKINETNLSKLVSNSSGLSEQLEELKKEYVLNCDSLKDVREKLEEKEYEFEMKQRHEIELLEYTQKISDRDAVLQSQLTAAKAKVEEMHSENSQLKQDFHLVTNESDHMTKQLSELSHGKEAEINQFRADYQTLDDECSKLKTLASDLKNELALQQRKYQNIIKDSGKEVIKLKRKLESLESKYQSQEGDLEESYVGDNDPYSPSWNSSNQEPLSRSSNASSTTSLNNFDGPNGSALSKNYNYEEPLSNQMLLNKLLKLQKRQLRKEEKIEFLEENMTQLVDELKRKNKILHHYFMKEDPGALSSGKSDDAKLSLRQLVNWKYQAHIMKKGGIMASVYGSSTKDGSMTLDLSLEINNKLEAVLEDTLLKNITLKENLNTLADEIATLTKITSSA